MTMEIAIATAQDWCVCVMSHGVEVAAQWQDAQEQRAIVLDMACVMLSITHVTVTLAGKVRMNVTVKEVL